MEEKMKIRYFLGANSARGFYSLYDGFVSPEEGDFLWVIKGGPGCGKSTFMKKIGKAAESARLSVEYIQCSGDPDSLDGIYIKEKRWAYVDGTSPHIMDCALPGGGGLYLDLGAFYRPEPLVNRRVELAELHKRYKEQYAQGYRLLSAAAAVDPGTIPGLQDGACLDAVKKRAAAFARRYIPMGQGSGEKRRFLSAISGEGIVFLWESVAAQCKRICTLDDSFGLAHVFLEEILAACTLREQPLIVCPDPLLPERLEAILLPTVDLAFVALRHRGECPYPVWRHIRLDAMVSADRVKNTRREFRERKRLQQELMENAVASLAQAKSLHDELEAVYNPHVDFAGQNELCQLHMDYLLGRME